MIKLVKYLKASILSIVMIVALLLCQAMADLSLPEYTSKIVNVGIQQGGIEEISPKVIRESEMNRVLLFVSESEKEDILSHYKLVQKESDEATKYLKKYPKIKDYNLYILDTLNKEELKKIDDVIGLPLLITYMLESDNEESIKIKDKILESMPENIKEMAQKDIFAFLQNMSSEQIGELQHQINEKFESMPKTMIEQSAPIFLKEEYRSIGLSVDALQNNYIIISGLKMLAIALFSMLCTIGVGFLGSRVAARLGRDLRAQVFAKVMSFSNTEFKEFSTATLITRSTNDIQQIQTMMVMLLRIVFYAPIIGIGGFIKTLNTNTSMAWIIGLAIALIICIVITLFISVMPKFKRIQQLVDHLNLVAREILTGLSVIRAFSNERHEEKRFDEANQVLTKTNLFVNRVMSGMMPLMMLVMDGIMILIVWRGGHSIDAGMMQVGDLMAFIQYTMQIIMAFLMICMLSIMLPRAAVSANRVGEILDTKLVITDPSSPMPFDETKKGLVEFKDVSFKYPDAEEDVITNITFTAKPGETTAFIGSTGSGKSTVINLIPRFFDVSGGEILVDGVDIRKVSGHDLRKRIGYVPQQGILFSGTVASNVKYGDVTLSEEQVKKALEIAQAKSFVESLPEKEQSPIAQGGTNVSGGQKQRLSIARAIAKEPEIYIFDDSFSALDFKTDAALRKALKEEIKESTVLIVAQRVSTIMHADQIIVMEEGKIAGIGTHQELMKNCDVYKQIALSQLSKEELESE